MNNHLLSIAGWNTAFATDEVLMYDPDSNSWSVVSRLSAPRCESFAVVSDDGRVIIVGGWNDEGCQIETLEVGTLV